MHSPAPAVGEIVRVRQRQYLVEDVVPPPMPGQFTLIRLAGVDDDNQGRLREVLWEAERDAQPSTSGGWANLSSRDFDPPDLFSAYYHTLRWNRVTATDARLFQAPYRAGIHIDAYQLEPLRKALLLPRVNLFIADDVGLGKTIEAGLIARELLLRKKVRDIVVCCPPSVLPQWKDELENRFGLTFAIVDREFFARVRRERGYQVNPWKTNNRFLISNRLLVDEAYTAPLRDWLGEFRPGSLLILDEAHHIAPASGAKYAIDSKLTRAARDLAPRFEHRLFLSATPHNGHSNSFSALLEILDPLRFCRGVPVKGKKLLDAVMVRRLKDDLRNTGADLPKREVVQIDISGLKDDAPELALSQLLDRYRRSREERFEGQSRRKRALASLLTCGLQQRLLSSVEAFARTLKVHRRGLEKSARHAEDSPGLYDLVGEGLSADDDRATLDPDQLIKEEEAQLEAATAATSVGAIPESERKLLEQIATIAEAARHEPDARVERLLDWIRKNLLDDRRWNNRRVLIFTGFEDTLRYLRQQIEAGIDGTDRAEDRIEVYRGSTSTDERERIKKSFNADPAKHAVRILLATDAAREGLNLQTHCRDLFHFDVPWNPARLEQRNGRIDRKLQPAKVVNCYYFVYTQRPEDRVLRAMVRKTDTIRRELGSLSQVIEDRLARTPEGGIRHETADRLAEEIASADLPAETKQTVVEELDDTRERQKEFVEQLERLRDLLDKSHKWVGMEEDHFRAAVSCGLRLAGAPGLQAGEGKQFTFPAEVGKSDAGWVEALDSLRSPRPRDQKLWEWRNESPVRPVVFSDPGTMTDEVVHLHLEHPVVRRLLGRFAAQGFVYDDLSRACLAQTKDSIPRVALIGRLCLYGPQAARLHEEVIAVTARWIDPIARKGPLQPYAREGETNTLDLIEKSLLDPGKPVTVAQRKKLLVAAPGDVEQLLPQLTQRGNELAAEAEHLLAQRGNKEADDMRTIQENQRKRIIGTQKKTENLQAGLFDKEEMKQLESDRRHWNSRLDQIEAEIQREPERIRELYRVKAKRVEPVGLVYLWPASG